MRNCPSEIANVLLISGSQDKLSWRNFILAKTLRSDLYIFISSLSYHSFVSVHDIQQKQPLNKISVTLLLIKANISVLPMWRFLARACWSPVTSSEVTWIMWSPLWNLYYQEQCISVAENHRTYRPFPIARPKCLTRDFTNLNRIDKPIGQMSDEPWKFFVNTDAFFIATVHVVKDTVAEVLG